MILWKIRQITALNAEVVWKSRNHQGPVESILTTYRALALIQPLKESNQIKADGFVIK